MRCSKHAGKAVELQTKPLHGAQAAVPENSDKIPVFQPAELSKGAPIGRRGGPGRGENWEIDSLLLHVDPYRTLRGT